MCGAVQAGVRARVDRPWRQLLYASMQVVIIIFDGGESDEVSSLLHKSDVSFELTVRSFSIVPAFVYGSNDRFWPITTHRDRWKSTRGGR
jgi:tRNA(His) 5'-end guanylyltransferase